MDGSLIDAMSGAADRRNIVRARDVAFVQDRRRLKVGLVNNMPDAALVATERQFRALLQAAAPERRVELHLFHVLEIPRGPEAAARLAGRSRPVAEVEAAGLDALIVTGAEPRAADLRDEPFWAALAQLADWADTAGPPSLWSCLAAHAAALHLDGVGRRRLPAKCSGLYPCAWEPAAMRAREPLLKGIEAAWVAPHSRHNALDEEAMAARGYRILTRAGDAGVDAAVREGAGSLMLFLQGHPEYDAASLALEFKRDLQRFLGGVQSEPPALPQGVFQPATAERLRALLGEAVCDPRPNLMRAWPLPSEIALAAETWRAPAARLYRNWLASPYLAAGATGPLALTA